MKISLLPVICLAGFVSVPTGVILADDASTTPATTAPSSAETTAPTGQDQEKAAQTARAELEEAERMADAAIAAQSTPSPSAPVESAASGSAGAETSGQRHYTKDDLRASASLRPVYDSTHYGMSTL
jgi:hypothetical protein